MYFFRVDTDQCIRQKALELNDDEQLKPEAFEYYEFEGKIIFYYVFAK